MYSFFTKSLYINNHTFLKSMEFIMKLIKAFLLFLVFFIPISAIAMETTSIPDNILKKKGPITVHVRDGISTTLVGGANFEALLSRLEKLPMETVKAVKGTHPQVPIQKLGFTFSPCASWNTLEAIYILSLYKSTGELVRVADLACGKGSFTLQALCAGGNVFAMEQDAVAAKEAIRKIWGDKGFPLKSNCEVVRGSIIVPGPKFWGRKNQVVVLNNIIHQLTPADVDKLLANVWKSLEEGGVAFICCDTTAPFPQEETTYLENVGKGIRYPGYGIVNVTQLETDNREPEVLTRSFKNIPHAEEQKFPMGFSTLGSYPQHTFTPAGTTAVLKDDAPLLLRDPADRRFHELIDPQRRIWDKLSAQTTSYKAINSFIPMNVFDEPELKSLVEGFKFEVINAWYTNTGTNILSPCVSSPKDTKLVMAFRKPQGL
jgi:hypothetical protein